MKKLRSAGMLALLLQAFSLQAQPVRQLNSSEILHEIQKLPVQPTVLYVAAHPDDENTRLITWLANEKKVRTCYFSLTRGDGGQNLIGTELGVELGMIRTQELLEARKIDGGEQYFSRAYDFGFSKTPEETFRKWNKDSVLSDMVWIIRLLQPDIIITRFTPLPSPTHGHHTASAILAYEAFDLAADPTKFPQHFAYGVTPWKTHRLFFNASTFWNPKIEELAAKNDSFTMVDVGGYNALLGRSYTEIAGQSRTMHKSQGFGSAEPKGTQAEFLQLLKGDAPKNGDIFHGVQFQVNGWGDYTARIEKIIKTYDPANPNKSIAALFELLKVIPQQSTGAKKDLAAYKIRKIQEIILQCSGIWLEAVAEVPTTVPGDKIAVKINAVKRTPVKAVFAHYETSNGLSVFSTPQQSATLDYNKNLYISDTLQLATNHPLSQPYWLEQPLVNDLFFVPNQQNIGKGENAPAITLKVTLEIENHTLVCNVPLVYKTVDPVKGEQYSIFQVLPANRIEMNKNLLVFTDNTPQPVTVLVWPGLNEYTSLVSSTSGNFSVQRNVPKELQMRKGQSVIGLFNVLPEEHAETGDLFVQVPPNSGLVKTIRYDHIYPQVYVQPAHTKLVKLDLKKGNEKIGYIMGAGDEVPDYIRNIGYSVTLIPKDKIQVKELQAFDVVIVGIRAYNTLEELKTGSAELLSYVQAGGRVIVQYNVNRGLKSENIGPYPFKIERDRVTEEDAEMRILDPAHPIVNVPNVLNEKDFEGWVQERGLYFAANIDGNYQKIFSCNDANEPAQEGSTIATHYGKGTFIYTGLSFFRQLPAGVPGAYRLLVNMISYK